MGSGALVAADPGVDMEIDGDEEAVGLAFVEDLDLFELVIVIEQHDVFSDQGNGSLIESAVEGNGAIFGDPPSGRDPEVIPEIARSSAKTLGVGGETREGSLARGGVCSLVIDIVEP